MPATAKQVILCAFFFSLSIAKKKTNQITEFLRWIVIAEQQKKKHIHGLISVRLHFKIVFDDSAQRNGLQNGRKQHAELNYYMQKIEKREIKNWQQQRHNKNRSNKSKRSTIFGWLVNPITPANLIYSMQTFQHKFMHAHER